MVLWRSAHLSSKPKPNRNVEGARDEISFNTLEYSNSIGAIELKGTWGDPDFNPGQNAFYYVRLLEIPTPRSSKFDAKELRIPHPEGPALAASWRHAGPAGHTTKPAPTKSPSQLL